jgi:hypothetical protein
MLTWTKNTITYWRDLYSELRIWWVFKKTADQNTKLLNDSKLRVDWLGRVYTVVNLPEEVQTASPEIQQAYVLQKISEFGDVMMKIGLGDIVYPEIQKINGTAGWLVVLWPSFENLQTLTVISYIFRSIILFTVVYLLTRLFIVNFEHIRPMWNYLASFF